MNGFVPLDNYSTINSPTTQMNNYHKFEIFYKILILLIGIFIVIFLVIIMSDLKTKSINTLDNINTLTLTFIQIIQEHNITLVNLENKINNIIDQQSLTLIEMEKEIVKSLRSLSVVLSNLNDILINYNNNFNTPEVTNEILNIINNLDVISTTLNVTNFQTDLHRIACELSKSPDKDC